MSILFLGSTSSIRSRKKKNDTTGYDENIIWFVRTVQGGWFSIDVQSSWQSGYLDVDGSIYNEVKKWFEEEYHNNWYDEQLKAKGELI